MSRFFMYLAYDGTNYHGWQIQPNAVSVQEAIEEGFYKLFRKKIGVTGCGRTDTGVHASFYVAHFEIDDLKWTNDNFIYKINAVLPKDIVIYDIKEVDAEYHARFDAVKRQYHYIFAKQYNPFTGDYAAEFRGQINVDSLQKAALVVAKHTDFTSFCKLHSDNKTNICNVSSSNWFVSGDFLIYRIEADRFLRNMVRALVGTMMDVGLGKISLEKFNKIFEAKDRSAAGVSADGKGLYLSGVWYKHKVFTESFRLPFMLPTYNNI